jgi:MerR family transcriptional regulator, light-induced transcriptional regulator
MRTLKTSEAAALLNVTANTLRAWERRFGYPKPQRSRGNHRLYTYAEVAALREALEEGLSISSAVSVAREALSTDVHALVRALTAFSHERADRAMEGSLGLRSVERSVEEVLLRSLREVQRRKGPASVHWAFAAGWAVDWLRRARRLAAPPGRRLSLLIGDASGNDLDPTAAQMHALELFCRRAGAETLSLPVEALESLGDAVSSASPDAVVIAGVPASDDVIARWAYGVRTAGGELPLALFHRDVHAVGPDSRATVLPASASAAQTALFGLVDRARADRPPLRLAASSSLAPVTGAPRRIR